MTTVLSGELEGSIEELLEGLPNCREGVGLELCGRKATHEEHPDEEGEVNVFLCDAHAELMKNAILKELPTAAAVRWLEGLVRKPKVPRREGYYWARIRDNVQLGPVRLLELRDGAWWMCGWDEPEDDDDVVVVEGPLTEPRLP